MASQLSQHVRELLEPSFPFDDMLAEVPLINRRLGLNGPTAFDHRLKPVFFVGNLDAAPRYLLVGLKPGLGADSKPSFEAERKSLSADVFDAYWWSRLDYFESAAFNGTHYVPIAKLLGSIAGTGFPASAQKFLHESAIQVEMFPLFAAAQGFDVEQLRWLHRETRAGQCAVDVLETLVASHSWDIAIARYKTTFEVLCQLYDGLAGERLGIFPTAYLTVGGKRLRLVCLHGIRGITNAHLALEDDQPPVRARSRSTPNPHVAVTELRERILGLDSAIGFKNRAGDSVAFDVPYGRGRRNFACITPRVSGVRLDALGPDLRFVDGLLLPDSAAVVERCREALSYLR